MKLRNLALAACLAVVGITAFAQPKEQFFPALPYRTGPFAPNGVPWANGYLDYLKLTNARGGINGVNATNASRARTAARRCSNRFPPASPSH